MDTVKPCPHCGRELRVSWTWDADGVVLLAATNTLRLGCVGRASIQQFCTQAIRRLMGSQITRANWSLRGTTDDKEDEWIPWTVPMPPVAEIREQWQGRRFALQSAGVASAALSLADSSQEDEASDHGDSSPAVEPNTILDRLRVRGAYCVNTESQACHLMRCKCRLSRDVFAARPFVDLWVVLRLVSTSAGTNGKHLVSCLRSIGLVPSGKCLICGRMLLRLAPTITPLPGGVLYGRGGVWLARSQALRLSHQCSRMCIVSEAERIVRRCAVLLRTVRVVAPPCYLHWEDADIWAQIWRLVTADTEIVWIRSHSDRLLGAIAC
mmetsp:Transcript_56889/g.151877  ORF Transcript_56889/g.151877 Transcript_56889/m.151877 type:complete len:324 (+) Transcript_56889:1411-2382(+)